MKSLIRKLLIDFFFASLDLKMKVGQNELIVRSLPHLKKREGPANFKKLPLAAILEVLQTKYKKQKYQ